MSIGHNLNICLLHVKKIIHKFIYVCLGFMERLTRWENLLCLRVVLEEATLIFFAYCTRTAPSTQCSGMDFQS